MKTVIIRSFLFAFFAAIVMYISRILLRTDLYIADVSGLSAFATVFGTLYGIITAFIVFEVWGQFSQTQHLVEKEAMEIERLYRLTLYFKDKKFKLHMKKIIEDYTQLVIKDKFQYLGGGSRHEAEDKVFRKIAHLIRDISPDNDHDRTVFDHIVAHYGDLSDLRTDRINHSLLRLPPLLKTFLYIATSMTLILFIIMPFVNVWYGVLCIVTLAYLLAMVMQLIEDLDNPFVGFWTITPEPFERAFQHIEEDY